MRRKLFLGSLALIVLVAAGAAWFGRTSLLTWYYVRGLSRSDERDRHIWVRRVIGLDRAAVPALIDCLRQDDLRTGPNAAEALGQLAEDWQPGDPRILDLAEKLADAFSTRSPSGQLAVIEVQARLLRTRENDAAFPSILTSLAQTLSEAARQPNTRVHAQALAQAAKLMGWSNDPKVLEACRQITLTCLRDDSAPTRTEAIRLAMRPELNLLEQVAPLLYDPEAEVRRCAILAVGTCQSAIGTDELLPWLHDPDPDVRRLCEEALRSRGLQDHHVKLGRLMTDKQPVVRLQVLDLLHRANDLEPGIWLRRLSHDPSPAVRAAAVRAATEQPATHLADRLEQMAQNDPSPTVRQIAQYYLSMPKNRQTKLMQR